MLLTYRSDYVNTDKEGCLHDNKSFGAQAEPPGDGGFQPEKDLLQDANTRLRNIRPLCKMSEFLQSIFWSFCRLLCIFAVKSPVARPGTVAGHAIAQPLQVG
jgi:hypothetical protein